MGRTAQFYWLTSPTCRRLCEQAADWIATANNYRTQCYTIIISFTPEETALLRSMPDNGRDKVRTIIGDFLDELSARGNDVSACPYIVARHDNTDNEHYHIVIRTTDVNGKRFRDNFINKNANRAAACIAMKYGLEAPKQPSGKRLIWKLWVGGGKNVHAVSTSHLILNLRLMNVCAAKEP